MGQANRRGAVFCLGIGNEVRQVFGDMPPQVQEIGQGHDLLRAALHKFVKGVGDGRRVAVEKAHFGVSQIQARGQCIGNRVERRIGCGQRCAVRHQKQRGVGKLLASVAAAWRGAGRIGQCLQAGLGTPLCQADKRRMVADDGRKLEADGRKSVVHLGNQRGQVILHIDSGDQEVRLHRDRCHPCLGDLFHRFRQRGAAVVEKCRFDHRRDTTLA
jgi:hypothetical protein